MIQWSALCWGLLWNLSLPINKKMWDQFLGPLRQRLEPASARRRHRPIDVPSAVATPELKTKNPKTALILVSNLNLSPEAQAAGDVEASASVSRSVVTLSGLLNVLDGFHAPENVIFVMTTNDIQALDPALLRPGRIDYRLHMSSAGSAQKVQLYRRFFPEALEREAISFASAQPGETMAEFQRRLLQLEQASEVMACSQNS